MTTNNCKDCALIDSLYKKVDCSIFLLIKNMWNSRKYGVSLYFDSIQYDNLIHYKKILYRIMTNQDTTCISSLVGLINKELYKSESCPKCNC